MRWLSCLGLVVAAAAAAPGAPAAAPVSNESEYCLACHQSVTPGIVEAWSRSRHAGLTVAEALKKPELERRVSNGSVPDKLRSVAVGCYECHGLNPDKHRDSVSHNGSRISVVLSPNDCATCHSVEATQYTTSKKANAHDNLARNPFFSQLVRTTLEAKSVRDGVVQTGPVSDAALATSCFGCHGTAVEASGPTTAERSGMVVAVPKLKGWPNHGVGRLNPDGTVGACTSCHPGHSFSLDVARRPHTCSQCHLAPDFPAWDVWRESKHGNMATSLGGRWNWDAVPWRPGRDFETPTCAACHMSLLADHRGREAVPRSHDFGSRLYVRLAGLPYAHRQPVTGKTWELVNDDGQPLPTTFDGRPALQGLLTDGAAAERRARLKSVCLPCHSGSRVDAHLARLDDTVTETNGAVRAATELVSEAWRHGACAKANPFDEPLEARWVELWLFHGTSTRYGAAMSGPDYATFSNGRWQLGTTLKAMEEAVARLRTGPGADGGPPRPGPASPAR